MMDQGFPPGAKGRKRTLVLDTSAILSGKPPSPEGVLYSPPAVVAEFEPGGRTRRQLDYMLEAGLRVIEPTTASIGEAESAATRTGDFPKLSEADIEVLALARDLHGGVVTDDYAIQNVAAAMKIPFQPVNQAGITEVVHWQYKCRGCGKAYQDLAKECNVCGSEVRAVKG